jgi:hypothetical protein
MVTTEKIVKNYLIITDEQYSNLLSQIESINKHIKNSEKKFNLNVLDNSDLMRKLNVSKRLLQHWRDNGIIAFSQINGKIYYKFEDVQKLIDNNYKPATKYL